MIQDIDPILTGPEDSLEIIARRRSFVYRTLSIAFYPPVRGMVDTVWKNLISEWSDEPKSSVRFDLLKLKLDYNKLFVGPNDLLSPPYESVYSRNRPESDLGMLMGPVVIDIKKRYTEAGLEISKDFSDLPDHLSVELEFMCFLCTKEAESIASGSSPDEWIAREKEFLKSHVQSWIVKFTDLVLQNAKSTFYRASAKCLKEWIEEECEALDALEAKES